MNSITPLPVADRFVLILERLYQAVAARSARGFFGEAPLAQALIWFVCLRVRRVQGRISRMLARFQAGQPRMVERAPGGAGAGARTRAAAGRRADVTIPRGFAWLLPLVPSVAANLASQLRGVLAEPEMAALLAATPQAVRVLAPVCRMLGIALAVPLPKQVVVRKPEPEIAPAADRRWILTEDGMDETAPAVREDGPWPGAVWRPG